MSSDLQLTPRASLADGRQATLSDGRRKLIVRIFDEPSTGFRAATIQTTTLVEGTETSLQLAGEDILVRVATKRMEGRRMVLMLERVKRD